MQTRLCLRSIRGIRSWESAAAGKRFSSIAACWILLFLSLWGSVPAALGQGPDELILTDLSLNPKKVTLAWLNPPGFTGGPPSGAPGPGDPTTVGGGTVYNALVRYPSGSCFPVSLTLATFSTFDDTDFDLDTHYEYAIQATSWSWQWNAATSVWDSVGSSYEIPCYVTVRKVPVSLNQTTDSRLDLRFSTYHLKDYAFKNTIYRGGLFAGFNNDGSHVARTYLRFASLTGPLSGYSGEKLWPVGGVCLYNTRLARSSQSASLVSRLVNDNTWDSDTLNWTNAPTPATAGGTAFTATWNGTDPGQWVLLGFIPELQMILDKSYTSLNCAVMASSESGSGATVSASSGWAYFGRNTYTEGTENRGAYLLYAFGGPGIVVDSVVFDPTSVTGGDSASCTVTLKGAAPTGGYTVSLGSSGPLTGVPSSVTIPAGSNSVTFMVGTSTVTMATTAYIGTGTVHGELAVTP